MSKRTKFSVVVGAAAPRPTLNLDGDPGPDGRDKRQRLAAIVSDLVGGFIYYDRKEDEDMPRGEIEMMVARGEVSADEIIDMFASELRKALA